MSDAWLAGPSMVVKVPVWPVRLVGSPIRARQVLERARYAGARCGLCSGPAPCRLCPGWRVAGWAARWVGVVRLAGPALLRRAGVGPADQLPSGQGLCTQGVGGRRGGVDGSRYGGSASSPWWLPPYRGLR